jgi:hypothetical protein
MNLRTLAVLLVLCSCSEQTAIVPSTGDASASDGRTDLRADDVASSAKVDSAHDLGEDLRDREVAVSDATPMDGTMDVAQDLATVDSLGVEAGTGCQSIIAGIPGLEGSTVGWAATECSWASPVDVQAPTAAMALADLAEALSFRVRVNVASEIYAHQGYVSAPVLTAVPSLGGPVMEVIGPVADAPQGQYFFDLRWANQMAPREGMQISLTATFAFACQPAMSRTIDATTTVKLALCRTATGSPVWRAPGQPCDACDTAVDGGTDGPVARQYRWQQVQVASGFPARMAHVGLVFKDKMWVLGGEGASGQGQNDVWSSSDGSRWSLATSAAGWSPRSLHRGVVFQSKMWIIDGGRKSDVWSSEDGVDWNKVVEPAAFPARYAGQVVSFADKMWLIGGYGASGEPMNDVWSSVDGKLWTLAVASAPWSARDLHTCVVASGKIWLVDGERLGDVWASSDGSHWEQVTQLASFPPRMSHSSVFYQDKLWILGGYGREGSPINDVWMSSDGASWVQQTIHAPWVPRQLAAALVFQDKTWLLGGSNGSTRLGDVWTLSME